MRRIQLCTLAALGILLMTAANAQHVPQNPYRSSVEAPKWAQLMYSESPDKEIVPAAFESLYVDFATNHGTQCYTHWMRNAELSAPEVTHSKNA